MTKRTPALIVFALITLLYACRKKEGPTGPQGPAGPGAPQYYGVIAGHVVLYDQYGIRRNHDLNGIRVFLKDSISTLTDTNGYYHFDSVVSGNYNISAALTGFGNTMSGYVPFVKDSLFINLGLAQIPLFPLASFTAYHNTGSAYDSLVATFGEDERVRRWIVFLSDKPSVNPAQYLLRYVATIPARATVGNVKPSAAELYNAGISAGQVVYYAAYSYVVNDVSAYMSSNTGDTVYSALGAGIMDTTVAP